MPTADLENARAELEAAGKGSGRWAFMIDTDLAQDALMRRRYDEAVTLLLRLADEGRRVRRDSHRMCWVLGALAVTLLELRRHTEAHSAVREMLPHALQSSMLAPLAHLVGWYLADTGRPDDAALLVGAGDCTAANPVRRIVENVRPYAMTLLETALPAARLAALLAEGAQIDERTLGRIARGDARR